MFTLYTASYVMIVEVWIDSCLYMSLGIQWSFRASSWTMDLVERENSGVEMEWFGNCSFAKILLYLFWQNAEFTNHMAWMVRAMTEWMRTVTETVNKFGESTNHMNCLVNLGGKSSVCTLSFGNYCCFCIYVPLSVDKASLRGERGIPS